MERFSQHYTALARRRFQDDIAFPSSGVADWNAANAGEFDVLILEARFASLTGGSGTDHACRHFRASTISLPTHDAKAGVGSNRRPAGILGVRDVVRAVLARPVETRPDA